MAQHQRQLFQIARSAARLAAGSQLASGGAGANTLRQVAAACSTSSSTYTQLHLALLPHQHRQLSTSTAQLAKGFARRDAYTDYYQPVTPPSNLGLVIIPEKTVYVVERFGRYRICLGAGLHFLLPFVDRVAYVHVLKELAIPVSHQTAITRDNVTITIDGVLYVKVVDPVKASYGVDNALYAVGQLAQTTMRSELGKITLDKTFEERESLNHNIVRAINEAADAWGLQCLRYEIKDITPPSGIVQAMELQAEAERRKRASILESEGQRQSKINVAEADKQQVILASEASRTQAINHAEGEAAAIRQTAQATAEAVKVVAAALRADGGADAAALRVAEKYVEAFGQIAKEGNTILLPAHASEPASMVAQALSVFKTLVGQQGQAQHGQAQSSAGSSSDAAAAAGPSSALPKAGAQTVSMALSSLPSVSARAGAGQLPAPMPGSLDRPVFSLRRQ